jgi:hypothetical protein
MRVPDLRVPPRCCSYITVNEPSRLLFEGRAVQLCQHRVVMGFRLISMTPNSSVRSASFVRGCHTVLPTPWHSIGFVIAGASASC